jgi:UDP-N-acetylmuramate: L-alanyl-gamma-D-glutamyl-meso-diaminopimelate ligase
MDSDPHHRIPDTVASVHLIAVCGTAMGALAAILQEIGLTVSGSDQNVYPPMSTFLAERRIRVMDGFDARHLEHRPDLVVVGNAVTRDNPEAAAVRDLGLNYCSLPEALNHFAAAGKETLLVAGTHGKTTTSSLLAWLLQHAGRDPAFMIGGILNNFSGNYRLGEGAHFVVEGDEYDTAYFDKGPKFLHFRPRVAIVTGVEFDHADIFRDLEHVKAAFRAFLGRQAPDSLVLAYDADPNLADLLAENPACRVARYGHGADSEWRLANVRVDAGATAFDVVHAGRPFGTFRTPMIGHHNLLNALAAVAAAHRTGIGAEALAAGLAAFKGIKRRQEVRGVKNGVTVIDDFAHHPTAVRETVRAVREFYGHRRLVAIFEPRTNTSMRDVFQETYPACFDPADLVLIRKPPLLKKIPAGERFSSERLVADIVRRGTAAHYFEDTDAIIDFVVARAAAEDVVLVMSNGGFDNIHARLLAAL